MNQTPRAREHYLLERRRHRSMLRLAPKIQIRDPSFLPEPHNDPRTSGCCVAVKMAPTELKFIGHYRVPDFCMHAWSYRPSPHGPLRRLLEVFGTLTFHSTTSLIPYLHTHCIESRIDSIAKTQQHSPQRP
ncbi:hypothetical protein N7G274_000811 [Stereocaulon virgatum]|uniref:Uncharacterized protein n=1 Tax=Stereocaulon virgatum TaxID=373712 RepID=A0ABR4ATL8_9LECA